MRIAGELVKQVKATVPAANFTGHRANSEAALKDEQRRFAEVTALDKDRKRRIVERLNAAEAFEKFLATKYVGTKRFGLEGAESAIPILDQVLTMAAGAGMQLNSLRQGKLLGLCVLMIKHFFLPLIAVGLARIFQLNPTQSTVLLAFSALPTASTCYVLAARMGYNGPYVAGLVTLSTLAGMLSLPFALGVLR